MRILALLLALSCPYQAQASSADSAADIAYEARALVAAMEAAPHPSARQRLMALSWTGGLRERARSLGDRGLQEELAGLERLIMERRSRPGFAGLGERLQAMGRPLADSGAGSGALGVFDGRRGIGPMPTPPPPRQLTPFEQRVGFASPPVPLPRDPAQRRRLEVLERRIRAQGVSPEAKETAVNVLRGMLGPAAPRVLDRLNANQAQVFIVPKDKKITDLPEFVHLRGKRTFDGRPWESVRGITTRGGTVCAVGEETLMAPGRVGYPRGFVLAHELGHVVHHSGLEPGNPAGEATFGRVERIYRDSMKRPEHTGLGSYADANASEFFAQASAMYLGLGYKSEDATELKRVNKSIYDLLTKVYGPPRTLSP